MEPQTIAVLIVLGLIIAFFVWKSTRGSGGGSGGGKGGNGRKRQR